MHLSRTCTLTEILSRDDCKAREGEIQLQHVVALPIHGRMNMDVARTDPTHTLSHALYSIKTALDMIDFAK